ncbi:MAG: type II secretion system F family protein, partial [bacterium]|nr:type II secretion system F family protein [bacterium]
QGRNLSDAAASWGRPFTELIINLIRAGEISGKLGEVLLQASELLDRDLKLRRAIAAATLYPIILLVLIVGAVIAVVTIVIPRLLEPLKGQVASLPWPTRVVAGAADLFTGYWWIILPSVVAVVVAITRTYQSEVGRMWIDTRLLRVPALGRLLRDVAVARFTRTLATLAAAGIPILAALKVTKRTLGNAAMEKVIDHVCEQVTAGRTLAEPMEKSGLFPPMLIQIINLGERSGKLDEMMHQAARAFEDRTEVSLKLFTTAFPPVLIVLMAGVVGFIVAAVILALLQFQESVSTM